MKTQQRIFEFASGYTVGVKPGYDSRMIGLLMSAWDDLNPPPDPPVPPEVEERIKNGAMRKRKLFNDPEYLAKIVLHQEALAEHSDRRSVEQTKQILMHGVDPESIDLALVERSRDELEQRYGVRGQEDDVIFYLNLVGDSGRGKPGDEDYRPNELFELIRFISLEKGPPGALVQHLLMTTFQDDNIQQETGSVSGHLGDSPSA